MKFVAPQPLLVPIQKTESTYPINRLFFVGRNYEDHAKEMGSETNKDSPFFFTKSLSAYVPSGSTIAYPSGTKNFQHEMELVVAIGKPVFEAESETAKESIFGYACGLDLTRRDLQTDAKAKGLPWDMAKDVEKSAVLSAIASAEEIGHPESGLIELSVNGEVRQSGDLKDLVNSPVELIAYLSNFYHLGPGDLIYTGTPSGVGPVLPGDQIEGYIQGVGKISLVISS
ncbi:MAG: fumarylacetoacetase [Gammaproteobacteria bacterium]|nr:fumarylacetoacetase [Gammaproteobacteria bacterium]|tara:strand:+ start:593 stop:1276 length:684 start_codon:yes stop_codon:yes gene_type:complete